MSADPDVGRRLGFDSVTPYNSAQYVEMTDLATDYGPYSEVAGAGWTRFSENYPVPYLPNVSMGWDSSPRTVQSDEFLPRGYPYTPVLVGNTPELFGRAVRWCRDYVQSELEEPVLTINAWNEWTEGATSNPTKRLAWPTWRRSLKRFAEYFVAPSYYEISS